MNNGNILEQQFINLCGFKVKFVKEIASPQLITYYFNVINIEKKYNNLQNEQEVVQTEAE